MTSPPDPNVRTEDNSDLVGDRHRFLLVGMLAVLAACVVFAVARLLLSIRSGAPTPWWGNAVGAALIAIVLLWNLRRPADRTNVAAQLTAAIATVALVIPLAYGMSSTIWWLSLVALAMVLLGRRREALAWGIAMTLIVVVATIAEPFVQIPGSIGEPPLERALARIVFIILVVAISAGFRRVANERAVTLHESEKQVLQLNLELEDRVRERTGELERIACELRESEERYRGLFEQAPIGIYRVAPDGRILVANQALIQMLGYSSLEDLHSRNLARKEFQGDPHHEVFTDYLEPSGEVRGFESVWARKDGQPVIVQEHARAIRDNGGVVICYEGTVEDITARKTAEDSLRRLAAAVDHAAEAVIITDPSGGIEYVNPAFERITGYLCTEAVGMNLDILNQSGSDDSSYSALWNTMSARGVWSGRLVNRRKDGVSYEQEMTVSPIRDDGGRLVNFVAVARDVSREVELQKALAQSQKMEAVGRLAGGIAHDFNNLLQAGLAQVAVLHQRLSSSGSSATEVEELAQIVMRGASP